MSQEVVSLKPFRAVVFDAFGTLFDIRAVEAACEAVFPGQGYALGRLWEKKQLEHAWALSLMGEYADYEAIGSVTLAVACQQLGLDPNLALQRSLPAVKGSLPPYPDVAPALDRLAADYDLAILSNGTPGQLEALVTRAGWPQAAIELLSVDSAQVYKPDPAAYAVATEELVLSIDEILFVSSHEWDVAGAAAFGFQTAWINRDGRIEEGLGPAPLWTGTSLGELAAYVGDTVPLGR